MTNPRSWPKWAVGAVLIRLFLIPTHFHSDLLFIHYFPSFLSHQGVWDIYGYFGSHYLERGFTYYQPLVYFVLAAFQWLTQILNPHFDVLMTHVHGLLYSGQSIPPDFWATYSLLDRIRFIFWMKFPYLVLDLTSLWLILAMQKSRFIPEGAAQKWAFHPVVLFAVYMFGQHRMIGAFFLWLMLYFLSVNKKKMAFAAFGFLCLTDCYPLLLFMPALLCLGRGWRERGVLALSALIPISCILGPLVLHSGLYPLYSYFSPLVLEVSLKSVTLQHAAWVGPLSKVVLILFYAYTLIRQTLQQRLHCTTEDKTRDFVQLSGSILLMLYATTSTTVHYFMWVMPFWVLLVSERTWQRGVSIGLVALLFVFNLDSRALNAGLWVPLNPSFFGGLPSFHEWVSPYISWGKVVGFSRLIFTALCFYAVLKIEINKSVRVTHR